MGRSGRILPERMWRHSSWHACKNKKKVRSKVPPCKNLKIHFFFYFFFNCCIVSHFDYIHTPKGKPLIPPSGFIAVVTVIPYSSWMLSLNSLIPLSLTHYGQRFSLPNCPHMPLMSPRVFENFPPHSLLQPGNMCPRANTSLSLPASSHT